MSWQHGEREIDGLAADRRLVADLDAEGVENTTGYIGSCGRLCQAVTSVWMASVTVLMKSGETSTISCGSNVPSS